jgi:2-C-methyl-D-erythritol 4-phosphate cytidylyltransferase
MIFTLFTRSRMNTQLIIPAGGFGSRLGKGMPKALVPITGKPILYWTLKRLLKLEWVDCPIVIVPPGLLIPSEKRSFKSSPSIL